MTDVICAISDRAALITLNRPEKRNALTSRMLAELGELFSQLEADQNVDVLIITGADPAFSAGLDFDQLGDSGENMRASDPGRQMGPFPLIAKPVIAAVNGPAITGGFEIAMVCDIVVASERARFGDTHARIGLLPDWGISAILPHTVGAKKSMELLLTSNFINAEQALTLGMVNHVVPHEALMPTARRIAADIISNDQRVVRKLLEMQRRISRVTLGEGLAIEESEAAAWQGGGIDTGMVASRSSGVKNRNRERGAV